MRLIFEPLDQIARLAALVPRPQANLPRVRGIFATNSQFRGQVSKARRRRGGRLATTANLQAPTPAKRRAAMIRVQRLTRVFGIDNPWKCWRSVV